MIASGAALVLGASAVLGGISGSKKAGSQKRAAAAAAAERKAGIERAKTELAPWKERGEVAYQRQQRLFTDPSYLEETGGYKFVRDQGLKATTAARSNTSIFSGETLKALTEYSAGLASKEYANEWARLEGSIGRGFNASMTTAEMEAGIGEAGARYYDQKSAIAGQKGMFEQFGGSILSGAGSEIGSNIGAGLF